MGDRVMPECSQGMKCVGREAQRLAKAPKKPSVRRASEILSEPFELKTSNRKNLVVDCLQWVQKSGRYRQVVAADAGCAILLS